MCREVRRATALRGLPEAAEAAVAAHLAEAEGALSEAVVVDIRAVAEDITAKTGFLSTRKASVFLPNWPGSIQRGPGRFLA